MSSVSNLKETASSEESVTDNITTVLKWQDMAVLRKGYTVICFVTVKKTTFKMAAFWAVDMIVSYCHRF
jgi:hypothetical protein